MVKAQRHTRQREVVVGIVRAATGHPSAAEVYLEARKQLPHISLGTVYRILNVLQREGRVQDVTDARAAARFDGRTDRHPHLVCLGCGRVADFDGPLPAAVTAPDEMEGFRVVDYRLEFYGYCRECRARDGAPAAAG
jgi:Fe2+ or Zn2+ uptake regulation protein